MGRRLDRGVLIGIGLVLALLLINATLAYWNTCQLDEDAGWVAHTHEVRDLTNDVLLTLVDAETGQRGFLVAGDEQFLQPYHAALDRLDTRLLDLKNRTKDNAAQQLSIQKLTGMVTLELDILKQGIALRRNNANAKQILGNVAQGKQQLDAIRGVVADMRKNENDLLKARQSTSRRAYHVAITTGLLAAFLGLLAVGTVVWLLDRSLHARQKAAALVAEQREWFRTTLASIGDAVIATDSQGRVTFLNPVAQALTGWNEEEALGKPLDTVFKIINEESRQPVQNPALRALQEGVIVGLANHTLLIARDGTERPIDDSAAPIRAAAGNGIGAVLGFRDITERKRSERALARLFASEKQRSDQLRELARASLTINSANTEASVIGIIVAEAKRIFKVEQAEVLLTDQPVFLPPEALLLPLLTRNGRTLGQLALAGKIVEGFDDDDWSILTQLAHMATVAIENARLNTELREGDRRKDEFLAILAHELRNPLAPIRNSLYVMQMAGNDATLTESSRAMIERQLQQMIRLVDDLLDLSRISRGKMQLRLERVELQAVLNSAIETSRPLLEQSNHEFTVDLPSEPIPLEADPIRLAQVFANLLNNAAKYTERGGHIWLSAERSGAYVTVRVRDNGIGIAKEMLPRIFEMFTQVDRSLERSQGGLGIGLTLVRRLVDMHAGTVTVHSEGAGRGTEFVVRLAVMLDGQTPAEHEPSRDRALVAQGQQRRILVVDDNRDSADSLSMLLKMQGNEVRTAYDGLEAVDAAVTFKPEVVLLDLGLPRLNGYDAARRIRAQTDGKQMVLIALTGWGQEEDRRRSAEAGFDHHLVKPVASEVLSKLLASLKLHAMRPD